MKSVILILAEVKGDLMPFTQICIGLLGAIMQSRRQGCLMSIYKARSAYEMFQHDRVFGVDS